jgi:hypothetical protein
MKSTTHHLAYFLAILQLVFAADTIINAPNNGNGAISITNPFSSASIIVTGVLMIILGFLFAFFGRKLFHITLFLAGAVFGAFLAFTILVNVEPLVTDPATGAVTSAWGDKRDWIYLGVCLAVGIVCGFLSNCLWKLGLFAIGAYGGLALALFILSWSSGTVIPNDAGRTVFVVVFCIVGGVLAIMLEHHVVIVSTAVGGSYAMCFGIDCFAKTGFNQATLAVLSGHTTQFQITNNGMYGLLVSMAVLSLIGIAVQEKLTGVDAVEIGRHRKRSYNNDF